MSQPALRVQQLSFSFGSRTILKDLNLSVATGQIAVILGGNGAGKSTLLKLILGHLPIQAGSIEWQGRSIGDGALAAGQVAWVPESVAVYEHLTGLENLRYFLRLAGRQPSEPELAAALHAVRLPEGAWRQPSAGYSKGMRQKLVLALALASEARLVLLDEPSSGLDPLAISEFHSVLVQALKPAGVTTLMVTHDLLGLSELADHLCFMSGGQLHALGSRKDLSLSELKQLYQHGVTQP